MLVNRQTKQYLLETRLWYPLIQVRNVPRVIQWLRSGCNGVAPHTVKMLVVKSYLSRFSLRNFVETGTLEGEMLGYIAECGVRCTSIELSPEYYGAACKRFERHANVRLVHGDSSEKLPALLQDIKEPTLFWLDGHYSGSGTAMGTLATPISAELDAILRHSIRQHVILIDDARCFDGTEDYPQLDDLLRTVRQAGRYTAEVSTDIIRLTPGR